jgi:hypothetical protein
LQLARQIERKEHFVKGAAYSPVNPGSLYVLHITRTVHMYANMCVFMGTCARVFTHVRVCLCANMGCRTACQIFSKRNQTSTQLTQIPQLKNILNHFQSLHLLITYFPTYSDNNFLNEGHRTKMKIKPKIPFKVIECFLIICLVSSYVIRKERRNVISSCAMREFVSLFYILKHTTNFDETWCQHYVTQRISGS